VSGFEPLTCRLQEACSRAVWPLPAPMPHESATTAPRALGLSAPPFHDPFHACLPAQADGLALANRPRVAELQALVDVASAPRARRQRLSLALAPGRRTPGRHRETGRSEWPDRRTGRKQAPGDQARSGPRTDPWLTTTPAATPMCHLGLERCQLPPVTRLHQQLSGQ
jgi:hypothetical protein